jgi:hypothetical protein
MEIKPIVEEADFYYCPRCKENSINSENVPCPRGSCEARIDGTIVTTIVVNPELSEEQKQWNKENYR